MTSIPDILAMGPVMPVIVIDDSSKAVPLAQALIDGGIRTIEITLRTPAALESIRSINPDKGDALLGKVIESFRDQLPLGLSKLKELIDTTDSEGLRRQAHAMKSMSGNVGATRLSKALNEIEQAAATGDFVFSNDDFYELEGLALEAVAELERLV